MYKNHQYFLSLYYRLSDLIALNSAFFISVFFRFDGDESFSFIDSNYLELLLFTNVTWLFISSSQKIYNPQSFSSNNRYFFAVVSAIVFQLLVNVAFNGLIKTFYSRIFLLYTYLSFSALFLVNRKIVLLFFNSYLRKKLKKTVIILFGEENSLKEIIDSLQEGQATKGLEIKTLADKTKFLTDLQQINESYFISEVYLPLSKFDEAEVEEISNFCDNYFIRLRLVFDWKKVGARKIIADKIHQTTVFKIALTPLDDNYNALIKRAFDLSFSLLFCIAVFSWLFPIIAIIIKLNSRGPVFFKQLRSGINNKGFYCYKFRSMRPNKEADTKQATQNDSRITAVGAFLRKSSLDELPQFINVIKGEMSIVGPRPHMLKHTEEYSSLVGNFMNRHAIKPGITGLAQIKGYRGEIDDISLLQNRIRLDRFYVNNWTLFFDIKIVALTVLEMFKDHK